MPTPQGKGSDPTPIIIGVVVVGALVAAVIVSQGSSGSSTGIQFSQPDPNSVAALASATAQESQAQTNYLSGIAQNGAAVATQLAADETAIRTAGINQGTSEYQTYVQAGSNQNIAEIQSAGNTQLAQIQAGAQEAINSSTIVGNEAITDAQTQAALQIASDQESASKTNSVWGGISGIVGGLAKGAASYFSGGLSSLSGMTNLGGMSSYNPFGSATYSGPNFNNASSGTWGTTPFGPTYAPPSTAMPFVPIGGGMGSINSASFG